MREWPYAKEPFDMKLFILLFWKRIGIILIATLIGAVLIGGGYYLKKVVFGGPVEYDITTTYYIQYNNYDPVTGEMHNYTNAATWGTWVVSDWYIDRVWNHALEAGFQPETYGIVKEDLKGFFTADLPSDVRIPTSTVTTPYEEATEYLNDALQMTYQDFANERVEMASIEITNETPLGVADKNIRTMRAVILGGVIGLLFSCFVVSLMIIWDDSIIIPEIFTYRYAVPMAGVFWKNDWNVNEKMKTNMEYLWKDVSERVLVIIGGKVTSEDLVQIFADKEIKIVWSAGWITREGYESIRKAGGAFLLVEAGAHNGKEIEHVLHELSLQNCSVKGAVLYNADKALIGCYRLGNRFKKSE